MKFEQIASKQTQNLGADANVARVSIEGLEQTAKELFIFGLKVANEKTHKSFVFLFLLF